MEIQGVNPSKENVLNNLLSTYIVRQITLWCLDMCSILLAMLISLQLIGVDTTLGVTTIITPLIVCIVLHTTSFLTFRCYSSLWRYAGEEEMLSILIACIVYIVPLYFMHRTIGFEYSILFYIVNAILITAFTGGVRLSYRTGRRMKIRKLSKTGDAKVLIIGGGSGGEMVIRELKENPQLGKIPVGIIDDDINKIGRRIHNVKILGSTEEIPKIVKEEQIDEIILAMAKVSKERKKEIINICKTTKCKLKTIPGIYEIIDGKVDIKKIRDVDIEDLLGREPIKVNLA